uniref:Uncharacterized protein n=1 Tax=Rhizophora mucronata TaxID=61149 RepID=A0A2P2NNJ1_RHIMU
MFYLHMMLCTLIFILVIFLIFQFFH